MSDDNNEELEEKPKGNKMMIIIIVAAVAVVAIIGVVVVLLLNKGGGDKKSAEEEKPRIEEPDKLGPLVKMDSFVVNVPNGERGVYLRTSLTIELIDDLAAEPFEKWRPIMRNEVLMYLSGLKLSDSQSIENKRKIEKSLVKKLNGRLKSKLVKGVYFTEFITQ